MLNRIEHPLIGRAKDFLVRAMEIVRTEQATPVLVGPPAMLTQAREVVGPGTEELVITDFDVAAIRERMSGEYSKDTVFLIFPANYQQFIWINRGFKPVRERGLRCIFVTGREFIPSDESIPLLGRMSRAHMFALAGHYVASQQFQFVHGGEVDYYEFGSFDGSSMSIAFAAFGRLLPRMKFFAFDTFAGIARSGPGEFSFPDGDWAANYQSFMFNMGVIGVPADRLVICPGDISHTVTDVEKLNGLGLRRCGIAHIDCDVFEPAKAALNLLKERMPTGGLIMFDDWDTLDASDQVGERRAAVEFLKENPGWSLDPYQNYGLHGRSFIFKRE